MNNRTYNCKHRNRCRCVCCDLNVDVIGFVSSVHLRNSKGIEMKRLLLLGVVLLGGCQAPEGWRHYITTNGRDGYSYDRDNGSTIIAVIFDEGHPELIDCTMVDC